MKKIIFLLLTVAMLGCESESIDKGQFDPNAVIKIRPAKGVQLRSSVAGLSAVEIVKSARSITYQTHNFYLDYREVPPYVSRTFLDEYTDLSMPALFIPGTDVIGEDGYYNRDFPTAFNAFIVNEQDDTIAYVPDYVLITHTNS